MLLGFSSIESANKAYENSSVQSSGIYSREIIAKPPPTTAVPSHQFQDQTSQTNVAVHKNELAKSERGDDPGIC